jgi:hypothetical protein
VVLLDTPFHWLEPSPRRDEKRLAQGEQPLARTGKPRTRSVPSPSRTEKLVARSGEAMTRGATGFLERRESDAPERASEYPAGGRPSLAGGTASQAWRTGEPGRDVEHLTTGRGSVGASKPFLELADRALRTADPFPTPADRLLRTPDPFLQRRDRLLRTPDPFLQRRDRLLVRRIDLLRRRESPLVPPRRAAPWGRGALHTGTSSRVRLRRLGLRPSSLPEPTDTSLA